MKVIGEHAVKVPSVTISPTIVALPTSWPRSEVGDATASSFGVPIPSRISLHPGMGRPHPNVLAARTYLPVDSRSPEFARVLSFTRWMLSKLLGTTSNNVLIFMASGSGAMEATIHNLLPPGSQVLALVNGVFAARFAQMAERQHNVRRLELPYDQPISPSAVADELRRDPHVDAVIAVHGESTAGIRTNLAELTTAIRRYAPDALILVDSVTSVVAHEVEADQIGIDAAIGAGHKCIGVSPGFAFVALSDRAWRASHRIKHTHHGFVDDFQSIKAAHDIGQLRFSPPDLIPTAVSLHNILTTGPIEVREHYALLATLTRELLSGIGCRVLAPAYATLNSVICAELPHGFDADRVVARLRVEYGVEIGPGRDRFASNCIRLGLMGQISNPDIRLALAALREVLAGVP